mmetsp:Transcript_11979/g.18507  ORF Transcript_11979/g.18507 Transcript_11979/m.18507 type:complete len:112 (-) Transcript_11979:400-735(-)
MNNPFRVRWDLFVMILSVWNSMIIPIELAFKPDSFSNSNLVAFNYVIDFMFFIDILLNFRTSFLNQNTGDEIVNPKRVIVNYATSSRFWIDLLSTIPFDLLMQVIQAKTST